MSVLCALVLGWLWPETTKSKRSFPEGEIAARQKQWALTAMWGGFRELHRIVLAGRVSPAWLGTHRQQHAPSVLATSSMLL